MKRLIPGLMLALAVTAPSLAAVEATKSIDLAKAKSEVEFLAVGNPSALKIHGRSKGDNTVSGKLSLNADQLTGKVDVAVESFDTGIDTRNHHMKEKYLEVAKFPKSELAITDLKLPSAGDVKATALPFKGNLTLHGVTKPVTGTADVVKSGKDLTLKVEFKLNTDDYNITTPSFMGITMAREVTVDANVEGPVL